MREQWDGRPENPERDGWHWLRRKRCGGIDPWYWDASLGGDGLGGWAEEGGDGAPADFERAFTYIAPALTPQEVAAAVQAEREACAEIVKAAAKHYAEWSAGELAADAAAAIRARGPADALAEALAQAERRGMERAAQIAAEVADQASVDHRARMACIAIRDSIRAAMGGGE